MITLRIEGNEQIIRAFDRVADPSRHADLLDQIGIYGVSSTQERFIKETGPDGIGWPKSLRAKEQDGVTLSDSGKLHQNLTYNAGSRSVEWGSNRPYAGIHQLGGTIAAKGGGKLKFRLANGRFVTISKVEIPARPFLGIDRADEIEIGDIVNDWLAEAFA